MSSGDGSQAYNEVYNDKTPDWCTVEAMKKNANSQPGHTADAAASTIPDERDGFYVGDHVRWVSADRDVPQGTIGVVAGFKQNSVDVRFDTGLFNFLPSELTTVSDEEAAAFEAKRTAWMYKMAGVVLFVGGFAGVVAALYLNQQASKETVKHTVRLWSPTIRYLDISGSGSEAEFSEDDSPLKP
eukprot:TRINITY_DN11945_c0_g2_i1.p1 TRINITY_DN11945_c0_g2~~TRINITY_DN11945_c0_g2_i1.p1  ORF type:complete len:185 (-),score=44.97 TRINITY_DN11945_c0_g2_i1:477-1031(-)